MKHFTTLLLVLAAALHAAPPAVNTSKAGMDAERLARIPSRMKAFIEKGSIAGSVTLVQRHGAVAALDATGYADLESKKLMTTDTIFQIMSMTKPVTAVAVMILLEEGKLALSDPVEKHLPEFRGLWLIESKDGSKSRSLRRPSRAITIRDLLTHTSGMSGTYPEAIADKYLFYTLSEVVALASQQPLDFEPGTKWQYSNTGISTLGRIVEVIADQPFEQFLASRIFQPLGMKDSFLFLPQDRHVRLATPYIMKEGKLVRHPDDPYRKGYKFSRPSGGMYSTATDMAAFYQMVLNGGTHNGKRLISKATADLMTEVHTGEIVAGHQRGMGYGLAWAVTRTAESQTQLPLLSIGSYGHGGAYGTHGWVDPQKDLVGVFMVQRPGAETERNAFMAIAGAAISE